MRAKNLMIAVGAGWVCSAIVGGPVGLLVGVVVTAALTLTGLHVTQAK